MKLWVLNLSLLIVVIMFSCTANIGQENHKYTNALINETSPYLLQHAHNPVDWNPWNETTLLKAIQEKKLLIISIGYSACHWCHVMEHESFEDSLVANKMNKGYISIKVDREERPDVDQVYMDAAQLLTGRGGWPLNIIALPDGRPVFAGTYFPKERWVEVVDFFSDLYAKDPQKLIDQAEKLTAGIQQNELPTFKKEKSPYDKNLIQQVFTKSVSTFDKQYGGKNGAPKFPMPSIYEYLLALDYFNNDQQAKKIIKTTLDNMAFGGIYDQLGGGFARYSTDKTWTVPHFEKMLYDNSQLVSLYSHAYQKYGDSEYARIVEETLEFVDRELSDESGGFYSSLDADSEGEEGKFYVWTAAEIDNLLDENTELFKTFYGITKSGNFESKNILTKKMSLKALAEKYDLTPEQASEAIQNSKKILMNERDGRVRPGLDDKVLTSWNALMITGYIDAYFALQNEAYLDKAIAAGEFLISNQIQKEGNILRNYKNGKSTINGFLDDYSHTILAFIKLYEATFDETWLYKAKDLKKYVLAHFSDESTQMFFYTSNLDKQLIARKMELSDNVIPASNSSMAHALFLLGQYFYNEEDLVRAQQMLANSEANMKQYANFYSNWLRLYLLMGEKHFEVAVVGKKALELKMEITKNFIPNKIIMGGKDEGTLELLSGKLMKGKTMIFVCQDKSCQLPVQESVKALTQMSR
jgi:uncharacterized protein YyaL (SSP411 family)